MFNEMSIETLLNTGSATIVVITVYHLVMRYFTGKIQQNEQHEQSRVDKENKIFTMFAEMIEANKTIKEDTDRKINQIKKLILNNTNMDVNDFLIFIKIHYQFTCLSLEQDINKIIFDNHIIEGTKILTEKKMENILKIKLRDFNHTISQIHFDSNMIENIIDFNKLETQYIKHTFCEAVDLYIKTTEQKKEVTYRFIHESMKSVLNDFITNLYEVVDKGTH